LKPLKNCNSKVVSINCLNQDLQDLPDLPDKSKSSGFHPENPVNPENPDSDKKVQRINEINEWALGFDSLFAFQIRCTLFVVLHFVVLNQ